MNNSIQHRLLRHRLVAHVSPGSATRPAAVVIPLHTGDEVRIENMADVARLIRTLRCCMDQVKQGGAG